MGRAMMGRSAYPGEWAFVLGAKLAAAAVPMREGRRRRDAAAIENFDALAEDWKKKVIKGSANDAFIGTAHLHLTVGMPATQTIEAIAGPTQTGEDRDEDDDGTSVATGSTLDDGDDSSLSSGDTEDVMRKQKDTISIEDRVGGGGGVGVIGGTNNTRNGTLDLGPAGGTRRIEGGGGMDGGAVAGGVVGALLAIALIALVYVFRRRLRERFNRWRYKQMPDAPTPPPGYNPTPPLPISRGAMSQAGPTSTLFGFDKYQPSESDGGPRYPGAAMIRTSVTTSRRESRKAKYVRTSLLRTRGGALPGTTITEDGGIPEDFYGQGEYPPEKPVRQMSDRFPIAVPPPMAGRESAISENPTLADGIIKTLAKTRPLDFPYPLPLIPPTPAIPVDSHFSWSTNPSLPDTTPAQTARSLAHASISTEGEPRFRGVHSWVNNQSKRLERQERLQERIRESGNGGSPRLIKSPRGSGLSLPDTPAEFRQHPGRPVDFGGKHERLMSADLDLEMGEDRK
ncbi:hypothetical protein DFH27DRAFT_5284 [Peziza echinospora]|nr:hypothetical protein DFH27DRAFT_5284 [Peziza echinospora]